MPARTLSGSSDIAALPLHVRQPGMQDYLSVWQAMQDFTDWRRPQTPDEIWIVEHPPVYTLGRAGKREHLLNPGAIPVIQVDRGGQVTYHGPGQLVVYLLIDLRRRGAGVRHLVDIIEQAVIQLLGGYGLSGHTRSGAPGVYVNEQKIAALGLRIRHGASYHGMSLNVDMDLTPFLNINPCGYEGLEVTSLARLGGPTSVALVAQNLLTILTDMLGYARIETIDTLPRPDRPDNRLTAHE